MKKLFGFVLMIVGNGVNSVAHCNEPDNDTNKAVRRHNMKKNTTRKSISIIGIIVGVMAFAVFFGACDNGTTTKQTEGVLIPGITWEDQTGGLVTSAQIERLKNALTDVTAGYLAAAAGRNTKIIITNDPEQGYTVLNRNTINFPVSNFDFKDNGLLATIDYALYDLSERE